MKQTSQTDPLRINSVRVNTLGGEIGMTLCPGRKDLTNLPGELDRDIERDLAVIADWGTTALLSLIEPHEFEALGVTHMSHVLPAGIAHFLPLHVEDRQALAPVLVDRLIGPRIAVNGLLKRRLPPRPLGQPVGRRRLPQAPFPFRPSLHPRCLAALL